MLMISVALCHDSCPLPSRKVTNHSAKQHYHQVNLAAAAGYRHGESVCYRRLAIPEKIVLRNEKCGNAGDDLARYGTTGASTDSQLTQLGLESLSRLGKKRKEIILRGGLWWWFS
jgi:hypothetical protein